MTDPNNIEFEFELTIMLRMMLGIMTFFMIISIQEVKTIVSFMDMTIILRTIKMILMLRTRMPACSLDRLDHNPR